MINFTLWTGDNFAMYRCNLVKTINELDEGRDWDDQAAPAEENQ